MVGYRVSRARKVPMQIKFVRNDYQIMLKQFLNKNEVRAYTMAILSFFALAFFTIFAIKPAVTTFFTLRKEIEDQREIDQQLDDKINALLKAQEEYQNNKDLLELTNEALPKDSQFTNMLKKIEDLAKERNAVVKSLNVDSFEIIGDKEKKTNDNLSFFKFSLSLSSIYQENETFLTTLINLRRIIMLDNIRLTKNPDEPGNKAINMDVGAKAYYETK